MILMNFDDLYPKVVADFKYTVAAPKDPSPAARWCKETFGDDATTDFAGLYAYNPTRRWTFGYSPEIPQQSLSFYFRDHVDATLFKVSCT
jgi:hypothetical protein